MKKIGIIGHFDDEATDGQTVKTREIYKELKKTYKDIFIINTKSLKNPIDIYWKIKELLKKVDSLILIVSYRGYSILLPIIIFFNKKYNKKIIDVVIGGSRYKLFDKYKFLKNKALKTDYILVETQKVNYEYKKRGFNNTLVMPNFKNVMIINTEKKEVISNQKIRLCTFSRVCAEKGIEDAIEAVKITNKNIGKEVFTLDIYGELTQNYKNKFEEVSKNFPNFINYKGVVSPNNSSKTLFNYDLMLFLTYWESEGFPGTIIDAFSAGLPVIATDWNSNFEIIKENVTGFKVNIHSPKEVSSLLIKIYNNKDKIIIMRKNCLSEAYKYLPSNVIKKIIDIIEEK